MIRFYTDPPIEYPYQLIKLSKFIKKKDKLNPNYDYIIDAGVYEFKKNKEYNLKKYDELNWSEISENVSIVIPDYPQDIHHLGGNKNITKTFRNIKRFFNNYKFDRFIPVIQFHIMNFTSFVKSYKQLITIIKKYKQNITAIGIGNMCKCFNIRFYERIVNYLKPYNKQYKFHFFGLWLKALYTLKYLNNISFDSTKWTRRVNDRLLTQILGYHPNLNCRNKKERIQYFNAYLIRIKEILYQPKITLEDFNL